MKYHEKPCFFLNKLYFDKIFSLSFIIYLYGAWYFYTIFIALLRACKYISNSVTQPNAMDWQCITCQDTKTESLPCSVDLTRSDVQVGAGYFAYI